MTPSDALRLFTRMLGKLEQWMDKATEAAKARSFEVEVLAGSRLAPDQYAFAQQVQLACDQAEFAAAYFGGKPAPPWLAGRWLRGSDYLVHIAVPNFFFHVTTAYAILRHNGVPLGKLDFVGGFPTQEG